MTTVDERLPDAAAVRALAAALEARDGAPPLSDQALGRLADGAVTHLVAEDGGRLVGYAQRDGDGAEVAGEPEALDMLLTAVEAAGGPLQVWTHGQRAPLAPVLDAHGYERTRTLHQLLRPDLSGLADPTLAPGIVLRPFTVGRDEDAWLAVNAAAFAAHPEQGRWTRADLAAREAEGWFDPAGFLVADRAGEMLGFHWTKVHPDGAGEVYVLGVSPAAQGLGLGGALLVRGLEHLRRHGCPEVLLYVDGDNTAAMNLYERDGFTRFDRDVQWRSVRST